MITTAPYHKNGINSQEILALASHRSPNSISIYLPTHRTGDEVLQSHDALALKSKIRSVREAFSRRGLDRQELSERLTPLEDLVADSGFWRRQAEGLAIFASKTTLHIYRLSRDFEPEFRLTDTFFLLPMLPLFSGGGSYYLLSLELQRIRLFEGNRNELVEIPVDDLIPDRLEDRVGTDYDQRNLQFKSQQPKQGGATYHGHDEADRGRKEEISRFFKGVDQGIRTELNRKPLPLLIASQDYLAALYKEASSYGLIEEKPLICNLSQIDETELHQLSWNAISPAFEKPARDKWEKFLQFNGTGKASAQTDIILAGALQERVDSLFVKQGTELRGSFDLEKRTSKIAKDSSPFTGSLTDLAIHETLLHGGAVYPMPNAGMAGETSGMAALFRY
ncbi:hypothetical protein [Robiginitalea sp. SC105]|uniref:baeRF7 domain-containing protein n=1 Tax=Robiginitalea sp. SC105 TaxID=2762332 RepID=UPI00163963B1|nr:hypothetical protein [Robiginitalea sp. SC105]MBC2840260.1 hypothetical protein [Robiginitalea sp. SC105]